jgi:hypothetical protein
MTPATGRHRNIVGRAADPSGTTWKLKKGANHKQVLRDFKWEALQINLQLLNRQ